MAQRYTASPVPLGNLNDLSSLGALVSGRITIKWDERAFVTQNVFGDSRDWQLYASRRSRYAIYWSHYEATVYRRINEWAEKLKEDNALYEHIRTIYSPAHRLGEFWATHLYGGSLDPDAGDGDVKPTAIPVVTKNEALRPALSKLWLDSHWQSEKEIYGRFGSVMGDVMLTVEDDPDDNLVRIRVIDPRTVFDVDEDSHGNVRGYVRMYMRPDPRLELYMQSGTVPVPHVLYKEVCRRKGDMIIYETFLDDEPFDWTNQDRWGTMPRGTQWMEDYGFVPFVRVQHKNIGLKWGVGEYFGIVSKFYEVDDQASKLGDHVRRTVECPWLFAGLVPENMTITTNQPDDKEGQGRQRVPIIYSSDSNAKAQALVASLNIEHVLFNIQAIQKTLEAEHPELTADLAVATGDASGRALRVAREKAEALITQRRAVYDEALVKVHQMAISIGAQKGYPGYKGFGKNSFANGELMHTIGPRAVFALNEFDKLEEELHRAQVVKTLRESGVPLELAMIRAGYDEKTLESMKKMRDEEVEYQLRAVQTKQRIAMNDGASYGVTQ